MLRETLEGLCAGETTAELSMRLGASEGMAKSRVSELLKAAGMANRIQLVAVAHQKGWTPPRSRESHPDVPSMLRALFLEEELQLLFLYALGKEPEELMRAFGLTRTAMLDSLQYGRARVNATPHTKIPTDAALTAARLGLFSDHIVDAAMERLTG